MIDRLRADHDFPLSDLVQRARAAVQRSDGEQRIFAGALAIVAVHLIDTTLVHTGWHQQRRPLVTIAAGFGLALAMILFARGGRTARAGLAFALGVPAFAFGVGVSLAHVIKVTHTGADYTGLSMAIAGLVLLVLSVVIIWRGRRARVKLLAVPVVLLALIGVIAPVTLAVYATHVPRAPIPPASTLGAPGARDVSFPARDGTRLSSWYVPGRNRGAVILMHGSSSSRIATLGHLRVLAAAGYAVLAYDARGHGDSNGQANAFGWHGDDDVAGALAFLRRQPGIDPDRIAALGLSMGAEEALRAVADGIELRAVIADGAGASTIGDTRLVATGAGAVSIAPMWVAMRATTLLSGDSEPAPLRSVVSRITSPVLLVSSNATDEDALDRAFQQRIGHNATLWHIADASHTAGLATHPDEYKDRILAFLADALPAPTASRQTG